MSRQYDLQKFFRGRLEIRQQTNFFQHLGREVLGLVDDQHSRLARSISLEQPLVQPQQYLAFLTGFARNLESSPSCNRTDDRLPVAN